MPREDRIPSRRIVRGIATFASVLAASGLLALSASASSAKGTVLSGSIQDPVTDVWDAAPATVRLVNRSVQAGAAGEFEIRHPRRRGRPLRTQFSAEGYQPYRTWTPPGAETERRIYLFPERTVEVVDEGLLPAGRQSASPEIFRRHFNTVYRDAFWAMGDGSREGLRGLRRWMQQPEIVIIRNVVETQVEVDGEDLVSTAFASERLISPRVRRRLKRAVRTGIGPLTGGFLTADTLQVRRMKAGEPLESTPVGELRIHAVEGLEGGGGAVWLDGHTIVRGAVWLNEQALASSEARFSPNGILHELGHTLGMDHPDEFGNTPLCSVMSSFKCYEYSDESTLPPFDRVIGRLAYSRLPGNDEADRDPRPSSTTRARSNGLTLHLFDAASRLGLDHRPVERQRTDR